jgi:hypothetical protein
LRPKSRSEQGIFGGVSEPCTWCGVPTGDDDGFRLTRSGGRAVFCRLEHVVPWAMSGGAFAAAQSDPDVDLGLGVCAHCGADLEGDAVLLVRHRGAHRIGDGFCDVDHLAAWAKRGGRFRAGA